jgi:hypothetical protein
LESS